MPNKEIIKKIGGQAVIEGVMIRSPEHFTVAVRKKDGSIKEKWQKAVSVTKKSRLMGLPVMRGIINMFEMIAVGTKALNFSAEEYADDFETPEEKAKSARESQWLKTASIVFSIVLSLAIAIFLFKFIPLSITEALRKISPFIANHFIVFNLIDGLIRIAIFLIYIFALNLSKNFRRIFEYHGAEHKTIFAYEKGLPLTLENIKPESPRHPRCGTSFIIIVLVLSILILSLVPRHPVFWLNLLRRLAVIPLIAGVSYEILKFSDKYKNHFLVKLLTLPGVATQFITTKEPDEKQIEVAVCAVKKAIELEKL